LQKQTAALLEQNHRLSEENQALRDELAVLKQQKPKPSIRPSRLHEGEGNERKNKGKRKPGKERKVDHTVVVKPK
jgi:regulator of replication initiation timing